MMATAIQYPIIVPLSEALKFDFQQSECGAWEDEGRPETGPHAYLIADRKGRGLRIENQQELRAVWYALCSGTFQLADQHFKAACRVASQLKPLVESVPEFADLLDRSPFPDGF